MNYKSILRIFLDTNERGCLFETESANGFY